MRDPRIDQLARNLVDYSTRVSEGDRVLIEATDVPPAIVEALVRQAHARGGIPAVDLKDTRVLRALYQLGSAETMDHNATCERFRMERTDVYIALRGSFHFTPGAAYEDCDNGNRSAVHWDLVAIQRPEHGGGEIWFDDVLIRRDGLFVLPELEGLNPDVLIGAGG